MIAKKSIWSFTAANFLYFDLFQVKGETPKYLTIYHLNAVVFCRNRQNLPHGIYKQRCSASYRSFYLETRKNWKYMLKIYVNFAKGKVFTDTIF